jgi:HSP20 family molecular chaperone IbpA
MLSLKLILDNDTRIFYYSYAVNYEESRMRILTRWEPSRGVDIYETEHELVVKVDLPEVNPKDLDIRVEIRGERKFEQKVNETTTCVSSARTVRSPAASRLPTL